MEYTLSLALVDFLPVIFTAIGYFFLCRMVSHINEQQGKIASIGAILIVAGGFFKAVWKLSMAATNGTTNIVWMDEGLFVWMAPGYTLLAWSVWQTVREVRRKKTFHTWLLPAILSVLTLGYAYYLSTTGGSWNLILLIVLVLGSTTTSILLIAFAFRENLKSMGVLFIINLICVFILSGLARIPEQTIMLQWIEESINTVSWFCFLIAMKKMYEYTRVNYGVDPAQNLQPVTA